MQGRTAGNTRNWRPQHFCAFCAWEHRAVLVFVFGLPIFILGGFLPLIWVNRRKRQ
jgi:hypothetical protein